MRQGLLLAGEPDNSRHLALAPWPSHHITGAPHRRTACCTRSATVLHPHVAPILPASLRERDKPLRTLPYGVPCTMPPRRTRAAWTPPLCLCLCLPAKPTRHRRSWPRL
ncbi:hypothetical protein E2562_028431 [Oryza meyeriana var. granulata]|uniref:Uncharacterized protein n=1 Tax=Oryza meyeriana var. granulata TaxID=110450 RepID=A0A6G1EQQ1_9ORYZ|nr:hypothetical protein E2562_028431 [Oryza meyeriana var. granulata]